MPSVTDWMSAGGAIGAAGAAIVAAVAAVRAARYTKRAADEAAKSAKSAAEQVELQRPRPVVLATFSFNLQRDGRPRICEFQLENIGGSPAFDVEISPMEVPDKSARLTTEKLSHLKPGDTWPCRHRLEPNRGVLAVLEPVETFANELASFFNKNTAGTFTERLEAQHQIQFTLFYRALDKRRSEQRYAFIVSFIQQRVWIAPVGSLLDNVARDQTK
jgi:hypothetical protein